MRGLSQKSFLRRCRYQTQNSDMVSILGPSLIVVGGTLSKAGDFLLSGIRELVYQRCLPLATRELQIVLADPQPDSALFGAAHLVLDDVFSQKNVEGLVARFASNHQERKRRHKILGEATAERPTSSGVVSADAQNSSQLSLSAAPPLATIFRTGAAADLCCVGEGPAVRSRIYLVDIGQDSSKWLEMELASLHL